jgi:membrane protein
MPKSHLSVPLLAVAAVVAVAARSPRDELARAIATPFRRAEPSRDASDARDGGARNATSPWAVLWSGWKDILVKTFREMNDDRLLAVAGGLVFFVLLAIFPTIAALVSIYALFADPTTINQHLSLLADVVPADSLKLLSDEVARIASKSNDTLGITSIVALLFALWSSNSGTKAVFDALNVAYEETEKRSFIGLNLISFGFTIGAILLLLIAAAAVVVIPLIFAAVGLQDVLATVLSILRWPILLVIVGLALAVLYRFGPNRKAARWRWVTPGSLAASLLWLIASGAFSFYLGHFANYNATYGSLGALIGLLMWLWITFIVVLAGAELDAEIEDRIARGSTGSAEKPIGARGSTG